jgi:hypothetical protein
MFYEVKILLLWKDYNFIKAKSLARVLSNFSCRFKAGFFRFWDEYVSINSFLCFFITFLGWPIFSLWSASGSFSQSEFGVEADAYANLLQFGNLSWPSDLPMTGLMPLSWKWRKCNRWNMAAALKIAGFG